jgi:hypothetical protein
VRMVLCVRVSTQISQLASSQDYMLLHTFLVGVELLKLVAGSRCEEWRSLVYRARLVVILKVHCPFIAAKHVCVCVLAELR